MRPVWLSRSRCLCALPGECCWCVLGSRRRGGGSKALQAVVVRAPPARAASHARPVVRQTPPCQELLAGARAGRLAWWGLPARRAAPGERELGTVRGSPPAVQGGVFWEASVIFARSCQRVALRAAFRVSELIAGLASSTRSRRFAALPRSAALPTAPCDASDASVQRRRVCRRLRVAQIYQSAPDCALLAASSRRGLACT